MTVDLTKLTPGQIAFLTAGATLLAAVLAGTFALVVAFVNSWSARGLARVQRRREYRLDMFRAFFATLDSDVHACSELVDFLVPSISGGHLSNIDKERFETFRLRLHRPELVDSAPTAIQVVLSGQSQLGADYKRTLLLRGEVVLSAHWAVYVQHVGAGPERLAEISTDNAAHLVKAAKEYIESAIRFRQRAEDFIFR